LQSRKKMLREATMVATFYTEGRVLIWESERNLVLLSCIYVMSARFALGFERVILTASAICTQSGRQFFVLSD